MNLKEYQSLLEQLQDLKLDYFEIRQKINNSGYLGSIISDMPKGGGCDKSEILIDLIDTEIIIIAEINVLYAKIQQSKRILEKYIGNIINPKKRLITRLKYVNGMSWGEIGLELEMLPDTVKKIFKRN